MERVVFYSNVKILYLYARCLYLSRVDIFESKSPVVKTLCGVPFVSDLTKSGIFSLKVYLNRIKLLAV